MDYRKPRIFGENWSPSRYLVLPYFAHEKRLVLQAERVLEIGCANGWNLSRFAQYGRRAYGIEINQQTIRHAVKQGEVSVASGLQLPFADGAFDLIYVQHVLHHIGEMGQALREIRRCLAPQGQLLLIETVEDNPIISWGRTVHGDWMGDEITQRFTFAQLQGRVRESGFTLTHSESYSILFWLWETIPDQFPYMEKHTPKAVWIERLLLRWLKRFGAHAFLIGQLHEETL